MNVRKVALVTNVHEYAGPGAVESLLADGMIVVGHDARFVEADVRDSFTVGRDRLFATDQQGAAALVQSVLDQHGRIDALIANDIVPRPIRPIDGSSDADYREVLEAGAVYPFSLSQAVLPHMRARKSGAIIFVTSATALHPMGEAAIYCASRAATTAYAIGLGQMLGPDNIQVNAVGPHWTKNPTYFPDGWEEMMPDFARKLDKEVPLRRLGTQSEIGALIALLASQRAMPLTAQFINFAAGAYP